MYHTYVKVALEKSLSSTQIAYRQQDNCTNTFIIYSTIPMSAVWPLPYTGELPYITRAKAAMDGYLAVIRAHQYGVAVESMNGRTCGFFCFEATVRSEVQSHVTRLTSRTPTQDHCTVQHQAIRYNLTYLRMGAQNLRGNEPRHPLQKYMTGQTASRHYTPQSDK